MGAQASTAAPKEKRSDSPVLDDAVAVVDGRRWRSEWSEWQAYLGVLGFPRELVALVTAYAPVPFNGRAALSWNSTSTTLFGASSVPLIGVQLLHVDTDNGLVFCTQRATNCDGITNTALCALPFEPTDGAQKRPTKSTWLDTQRQCAYDVTAGCVRSISDHNVDAPNKCRLYETTWFGRHGWGQDTQGFIGGSADFLALYWSAALGLVSLQGCLDDDAEIERSTARHIKLVWADCTWVIPWAEGDDGKQRPRVTFVVMPHGAGQLQVFLSSGRGPVLCFNSAQNECHALTPTQQCDTESLALDLAADCVYVSATACVEC